MPRILILDKENAGFSKISSKTKGYTKKNNAFLYLLRRKRFRLVSEQSKSEELTGFFVFGRAKNGTRATFRAVDLETASFSGASVFPR